MDPGTRDDPELETESVLVLKVNGIPDEVEDRLLNDQLATDLFESLDDVCDTHDIDHRTLSLSTTEDVVRELPTRESDIVEPVDGWTGGRVEHTGGNIFCRIFREPDRHLEVAYNADYPQRGVSLYVKQWDETYEDWVTVGDELDGIHDLDDDDTALDASRRLMRRVNEGVYDDEIAAVRDDGPSPDTAPDAASDSDE